MKHVFLKNWSMLTFLNKKKVYKNVLVAITLLLVFNQYSVAQSAPNNVSYNANTIPITGIQNTAFGWEALYNTTGTANVANGNQALYSNTTGNYNIANGYQSLYSNTTGSSNVANGYQTLYFNTTGSSNVANGWGALYSNTTANANTANGVHALYSNTTGSNNVADGHESLYYNTTGYSNTAVGKQALFSNITGTKNTGIGIAADVSVGTLNNATAIGANAVVNASNKIRLGDASVSVIEGNVAYSVFSDGRYKTAIKPDDNKKALDFIMNIKSVTYELNKDAIVAMWTKNMPAEARKKYMENKSLLASTTATRTNGLIAQHVQEVAQEVGYPFYGVNIPTDNNGNYSIGYSQLVMPLISTAQEQQKKIDTLQQQIDELKKMVMALTNQSTTANNIPITNDVNTNKTGNTDQNFKVYPNPNNGTFTINTNGINGIMEVYDTKGNKIKTISLTNQLSNTINLAGYAKGIYIINIISNAGQKMSSQKIAIQ